MLTPFLIIWIFFYSLEKGFEHWANHESEDDEPIDEKGLDSGDECDFNVIPIIRETYEDEDDWIYPEEYLKKSFLGKREETDR